MASSRWCRVTAAAKLGLSALPSRMGFSQSHVELGNIVAGIAGQPFRNPATPRRYVKLGEFLGGALGPANCQLLLLHRGAGGGGERQIPSVAVNLNQKLGAAGDAAADLERHNRPLGIFAADDAVDTS